MANRLIKPKTLLGKKRAYGISLVMLFAASGCQHHNDVRPSTSGLHKVSFLVESRSDGYREAYAQARYYCEQSAAGAAAIEKEMHTYIGSMDESTYLAAKTGSRVVSALGGAGVMLGGERERRAGTVAGVGGAVTDSALGQAYRYTMTFRCQ